MIHDLPYTDMHELNLDWFLAEFKKLVEEWNQVQGEWTSLHDYVQNYFDNLNVQTEIDNKINAMILDGTFADIVSPFVTAALPTLVAGQLPDVVAAQISAVVAAQISAVVAAQLPAVAAAAAAAEVGDWLAAHIDPDTGYVIDDTLTVRGAAADAKTVGDIVTPLYDISETSTNVNPDNWNTGLMAPNGTAVPSMTAYRYNDVISVSAGDKIYMKRGNGNNIATVERICAYDGENAVSAEGASNTYTLPYVVPDDIDGVIVTIPYSYFGDGDPYFVIVSETVVPKLLDRVVALENDVSDLENKVEVTPSWSSGYYVNNVQHGLSPLSGYNYSNLIQLNKGESIIVYNGYTTTATVVDMISEWDADNNYVDSIYPYTTANQYVNSTKYTATKDVEYIRICTYDYNSEGLTKIKVYKYEIDDIVNVVNELVDETILPTVSMFERVGFCGDSYVKGQIWRGAGDLIGDKPDLAWGSDIGRMYGITADIFASSGADTNTFQSRSDCLPALLASSNPCGLYIFCLGINDSSHVTTGTIADITGYADWHDYPNTFYGNYGKIIEQIMTYSPDSKIIIMTPYNPNYISDYLTPVTEITAHYGIAMIDTSDSTLCNGGNFASMCVGAHPTVALHSAMGRDIANLIAKCIKDNYSYFKTYYGLS